MVKFGLRTLFALVTVACTWVARESSAIRERQAAIEWIKNNDGSVSLALRPSKLGWFRRLLGDEEIGVVRMPAWKCNQHLETTLAEAHFVTYARSQRRQMFP